MKQVEEHLPTWGESSSPLLEVVLGPQLLKTAAHPLGYKYPLEKMAGATLAPAAPVPTAQLPITLRASQEVDKPISLVPYSKFHGELGSNLDRHISEFLLQCNANNARTNVHWHSIFPTTLEGHAKLWFYKQPLGSFPNWDTLRDAFVAHFRSIGYENQLIEQLADNNMASGEAIDFYYG